jgi:hypothetical protein
LKKTVKEKEKEELMAKTSFRDRVRQRAKEAEKKGGQGIFKDGVEFESFKAKKGTFELDFIPFWMKHKNLEDIPAGEMWYRYQILVHHNIGTSKKKIVCPRTIGEKCPICEYRNELMKTPGYDKEEAKALGVQKQELYNVIDRSSGKDDILLWRVARGNFGDFLEEEIRSSTDEAIGAFAEPVEGYTVKVRFSEETFNKNTFFSANRIDFIPRDYDYPDEIVDEAYQLDEIINILPYEELLLLFDGEDLPAASSEGDGSPEEKPKEERSSRRTTRSSREEEKEEKEEKQERSRTRSSSRKEEPEPAKEEKKDSASGDDECPFNGEFGTDAGELSECDKCELWDACMDAKDAMKASKKDKSKEAPKKEEKEPEKNEGRRVQRTRR